MPQPYTLVAKPVILSDNKTNVISHGRPLSPIGTVRSARPFFVPQVKGSFAEEKHGDTISHKPPGYSSSTCLDYQKSANENLMTINNNLSLMLKESFAGIDSICQKVRLCLLEANSIKPPENLHTLIEETVQLNTTEHRETRTGEYLESCMSGNFENRSAKNAENPPTHVIENNTLSTWPEEVESNASLDEIPEISEDVNDIAEIVEENEEKDDDQTENKRAKNFRRTPSISPFFTILNPTTQSAESVGVSLIKSMSSKLGLSRKCTTENFHKTMKKVEKLNDYEIFLNCMVEGINKEINECYSQYPKLTEEIKRDNDKNWSKDTKKNDDKKSGSPKSVSPRSKKRRGEFAISEQLKRFQVIDKMQRDGREDQCSYGDLTSKSYRRLAISLGTDRMDFTSPDVYRKRAITDLHKRLEAQIEANDSLIFFQKLMAKNKKHLIQDRPMSDDKDNRTESNLLKSPTQYFGPPGGQTELKKERSLSDLSKKYQNSLWFKQNKNELKRNKKEPPSLRKKRGKEKKHKKMALKTYTIESSVSEPTKFKSKPNNQSSKASVKTPPTSAAVSKCNCKIKVTNDQPMSEAQKCKIHWMRAKYSLLKNRKLKYLDILDDITKNDLLPIQAEYPRRDEIKSTTGVKASYLYKLTYEKTRDSQFAWEQLFQPTTKCSQENCQQCCNSTTMVQKNCQKINVMTMARQKWQKFNVTTMPQDNCHTMNVMTMVQEKRQKFNVTTIPRENCHEINVTTIPQENCHEINVTTMAQEKCQELNVTNMVHKEDIDKESYQLNNIQSNTLPVQREAICDLDKGYVIRTLSKYIFPDVVDESPKRVFTVMPVHVFYDNNTPRMSPVNRKSPEGPHQLPLMPMKETKEFVRKAEWNDGAKRTRPVRVVYDPILRKIGKEIRMVNAKPPPNKTVNQKGLQAHSWSPKNFSKYCAPSRCSNESRAGTVKIDTIEKESQKQKNSISSRARPQIAELFIKRFANNLRGSLSATTVVGETPKYSPEKVPHHVAIPGWNSPNLESYKQPKETDGNEKIPKTFSTEATYRMKSDQQRKIWEHKYGKSVGQKLLNFIEKQPAPYELPVPKYAMPKAAINPVRHQMMLDQLRCLKQKNDSIQTNIQKAIQVIEHKMVDILSKPTTSHSIEAFDEMEKEITNVLSLMKTPSTHTATSRKDKSRTGDTTDVPDELFHRLERILESPGMSSSSKSSRTNSKQNEKIKRKNKFNANLPPKSTDMNQVRFSSTSATGEEKFIITGISPKRPFKILNRTPYIKDDRDANQIVSDDIEVSSISSELKKIENELRTESSEPESDPIKQLPDKISRTGHEQVVNLALFPKEGSAGDQLQELKRLLENELKYVDISEVDKTPSIGVSYSQGDYEVRDFVHKEEDKKSSEEKTSDSAESEVDIGTKEKEDTSSLKMQIGKSDSITKVSEDIRIPTTTEKSTENTSSKMTEATDDVQLTQEEIQSQSSNTTQVTGDVPAIEGEVEEDNLQKTEKLIDGIQAIQGETETPPPIKDSTPESTKEIPENLLPTMLLQPRGSQLSLSGPYFTPLTSPLFKTRLPQDEDQVEYLPIVEEKQNGQNEENALKHIGQVEELGDKLPGENEHFSKEDTPSDNGEEPGLENKVAEEEKHGSEVDKTHQLDGSRGEEENTEETSGGRDYFYENVNRIISRVENVYSQLEEFEEEMLQDELNLKSSLTSKRSTYDHDQSVTTQGDEADHFLAPFIDAMKDLRQSVFNDVAVPTSRRSSPRKSSSLYNVLSFLDNLAVAGVEEERPVNVCMPRVWRSSYVLDIPQTIRQSYIYHTSIVHQQPLAPKEQPPSLASEEESSLTPPLPAIPEEPKKKSGCLKNVGTSRSNVNTVSSKSKQKVSFMLHKEEKCTQVSSCPFHSVSRILNRHMTSVSLDTLASSKKDEEVCACLDARENKSVDKMSLPDDETTYQSTFEFSDATSTENSNKNSRMPEQIIPNLQETLEKREDNAFKKNVVEIFRSSNSEDTRPPPVKVFTAQNDVGDVGIGELASVPKETYTGIKVFSEDIIREEFGTASKEPSNKGSVKVFYDDFRSAQETLNSKLIPGFYNENSITQVTRSLSLDHAVKKQISVEKLINNLKEGTLSVELLKESSLLEPLKNLSNFVDSKLLTEAVEKRQAIRMMKRKSTQNVTIAEERVTITPRETNTKGDGDKENLLKGFYVFVYLLMFTALNLEYKCVQ